MTKVKKSTDATSSQMWNIFQYVLAIEKLLNASDWDLLYIEKFWDLSINWKESTELKHHENNITLWDKHEDFWKTIYNWLSRHDDYIKFKCLILYTTARLPDESTLRDWNDLLWAEKYLKLKSIVDSWIPDGVKKYMEFFIWFNEDKCIDILERVYISTENDNLETKVDTILRNNSIFWSVKNKENRKKLFFDLMWLFLWVYADKNEILKDDFFDDIRPKLNQYYEYEHILKEIDLTCVINKLNYQDKNFIKELEQISIPENSVDRDIRDYSYANNQLMDLLKYNSMLIEAKKYNNTLIDDLGTLKDAHLRDKDSFKLYFDAKNMNIIQNEYFENNKYFQNWITHIKVDDGDFTWLY